MLRHQYVARTWWKSFRPLHCRHSATVPSQWQGPLLLRNAEFGRQNSALPGLLPRGERVVA
jgi:hypothetical protein